MDNPEIGYPVALSFMRRSARTVDRLLFEVERVLQSYKQFVLDESFGMETVYVHMMKESGQKREPYVDIGKLLDSKKSVIQIRSFHDLCCARALITAMARVQNHPRWDSIRKGRKLQETLAKALHEKAGLLFTACDIDDVKIFHNVLSDFQIHVPSEEHFKAIIYQGPEAYQLIFIIMINTL